MEIKGIIKQVAREGKAVMLDNDQWYSHFSATTGFNVGDAVKITYTDKVKGNMTYHNWTLIEPTDRVVEVVKPGDSRDIIEQTKQILRDYKPKQEFHLSPEECRCRALECAIALKEDTNESICDRANKFLEFIENKGE